MNTGTDSFVIDTHAHLDFKQFDQDRSKVIDYAFSNGVEKIINIGVDLESSKGSVKLAQEHDRIYATVGFHPHDAKSLTEESLKRIADLAKHKKVAAIGEIGLDFYRDLSPREDQASAFRKQIDLAKDLGLPLVVHVREAWEQALTILRETEASEVGGVLHSFSGNLEQAKTAQDMGFYLGLNGTLTYPNSRTQSVAREVSLDTIVVETDCPFLSPIPHRGKRNQPAYVRLVLEKLSGLLHPLTFQDVERITTLNACRLFGLNHGFAGRIAYPIRDSLYLNITNQCSNACLFCVRNRTDFVKGHNLRLDHEPTYREVIDSINHANSYREVVFCGYGEPTIRLDLLKEVAQHLKRKNVEVRLNTNGQGNLIHKRNIVPELVGLIDTVSISLNVDDDEKYERLCQPRFGDNAFGQVVAFARESKRLLPRTILTVLDMPEVDLKKCEKLSRELGVELRIRDYNKVG
ncbi:MAG: YchF/TatD family DNA exonuclease [Candidatus Zixiibacteriota bacterium]|nr:MAG: YchF/TatD family DNA exonuclease [candidate division Zixibacteria bacterium]